MKKATNAESKFRTDAVYKLLGQGWSRGANNPVLRRKMGHQGQPDRCLHQESRDSPEEDCELERPAWIAEALQRLRKLEQKASEKGQVNAAIQAIQAQAKLIGLET